MKYIKNKISILLLSSLGLMFSSCDEDKFLTLENENQQAEADFWKTSSEFNGGLTAAYSALQFHAISGAELSKEFMRSDEAGTEKWYDKHFAFRQLTFLNTTGYVQNKWAELYTGITNSNQVLSQLDNGRIEDDTFEEDELTQIEAQAKFLKAFYYFDVVHTYGQAVIQNEAPKAEADFNGELASIADVTEKIIIPNLKFAQENLPQEWPEDEEARVTWGAATAMLGKAYLYTQQWGLAKDEFKKIIDSKIYSLMPNFLDNFKHTDEFNAESLFEVNYSTLINPGVKGNNIADGSEASGIQDQLVQLNFGGFNTVLPSYHLHELFVNDEVDENNAINETGSLQSTRLSASIAPRNGEALYFGKQPPEKGNWAFGQSTYVKKYTNWYDSTNLEANNRSAINFRLIRYADVLLMYAEALLESDGPVNEAITYIDQVRSRAGVVTLQEYLDKNSNTFPVMHVSKEISQTDFDFVAPTKESVLTHIKRVERSLELCFEGHRYKDLSRWNIVKEVFDHLADEEAKREERKVDLNIVKITGTKVNDDGVEENTFAAGDGQSPLFIVERVRSDFKAAADAYSDTFRYLPIPANEEQNNPNIN